MVKVAAKGMAPPVPATADRWVVEVPVLTMEGKGAARRRGGRVVVGVVVGWKDAMGVTSRAVDGRHDRDGRTKALAVEMMVAILATPRQRTSVGGLILCCFWRKKEGWWSVGNGK